MRIAQIENLFVDTNGHHTGGARFFVCLPLTVCAGRTPAATLTTMSITPDTPEGAIAAQDESSSPAGRADRLAQLEAVCERIWPYVRYFAMAGACPDAIDTVATLGQLLGKQTDGSLSFEAAEQVRDETVEAVAAWFTSSMWVRSKIGSRVAAELAEELRTLPPSPQKDEA